MAQPCLHLRRLSCKAWDRLSSSGLFINYGTAHNRWIVGFEVRCLVREMRIQKTLPFMFESLKSSLTIHRLFAEKSWARTLWKCGSSIWWFSFDSSLCLWPTNRLKISASDLRCNSCWWLMMLLIIYERLCRVVNSRCHSLNYLYEDKKGTLTVEYKNDIIR